jgi:hypothetical protein
MPQRSFEYSLGMGAKPALLVFGAATLASLVVPTVADLAELFASHRVFAGPALIGIGLSLMTLGTTLWIYKDGGPSRFLLGIHDSSLLSGALLGALAAGAFL